VLKRARRRISIGINEGKVVCVSKCNLSSTSVYINNADPSFSFHVGIPFSNSAQVQKRYDAPKRSRNSRASPRALCLKPIHTISPWTTLAVYPVSLLGVSRLRLYHLCHGLAVHLPAESPLAGRGRKDYIAGTQCPNHHLDRVKMRAQKVNAVVRKYTVITMTERCVGSKSIGFWQLASQELLQK
jgi:hypothetical protein